MDTWVKVILVLIGVAILTWGFLRYRKIKRKYFEEEESEVSIGDVDLELDMFGENEEYEIPVELEADKCEQIIYVGTAEPVGTNV